MPDEIPNSSEPAPTSPGEARPEKRDKQKDKLRSAWISFVGRIVAQVVGALATVALGLMIAGRVGHRAPEPSPPASAAPPAVRGSEQRVDGRRSIAVLPLENLSGDPKQEYFADGMTEALISDLAQLGGLRVISRTSSMAYKGKRPALRDVARELEVDWIVEGSVMRAGSRVRVTAQLVDARRDEHLWAKSYDHTLRDILTLQGEVAAAVAREVKGTLTPSQARQLAQRRPLDPEAYDLYLRGRQAWNRRTPEGFDEAIRLFEQALGRDKDFALAHAGLADTYGMQSVSPGAAGSGPGAPRAKAAALRALELDPELAEAHTSLAAVLHRTERDLAGAEREFKLALERNPGYATAHQWYAILLAEQGRETDALRHAQQAVELDPLAPVLRQTLALVHYSARRFEPARQEARRAIEQAPQLPLARQILVRSLAASGQWAEVLRVCAAAPSPAPPELLAYQSVAERRSGNPARADALQRELAARQPLPAAALARLHAANGDGAAALEMLERARAPGRDAPQQLLADPAFDALRADPRFAALQR
jgi:TolB-like protein/Tfp pilus assembly protein PilF